MRAVRGLLVLAPVSSRCTPRTLLVVALAAWCTCVVLELIVGAPLTSDEAAYGLLARGAVHGWMYRPIGLVALAKLGFALGGSDVAMRLPCAVTSPLLLIATAAVGRRLDPWVGAAAALTLAGTHTFALRAPELLNDIPTTTCMLAAIALAITELERPRGPSYRLVAVAPLLAAAFYVRYGSAPVIAIIGLAAIVLWARELRAKPGPAIATVVVLAALVAPFAVYSLRMTGSVTGILRVAAGVPARRFIGQGLERYFATGTLRFYGVLITPLMIVGLASIVWPPVHGRRIARFLAVIALGQVIALGLATHASTRYVFLAMVLLAILGLELATRVAARAPRWRRAGAGVLVVAAVAMVIALVPLERKSARGLASTVAAATAIRTDAGLAPCTVIARAAPQLMWYSGCETFLVGGPDDVVPLTTDRRWYAADTPRRPVAAEALAARAGANAIALPVPGAWRITPR